MTETTEVAVRTPVHVGVRLTGLDEAYRLSQALAMAGLMPKALRGKPADVLAILLYGQEVGLAPMQAVQGIYVVEGRPTLAAQTWIALARRAGHQVTRTAYEPEKFCTVHIKRGDTGEEHTETATIEHAIKAGKATLRDGKVTARSAEGKVLTWEAYTDRMLLARAVSNACRFICPEIALGFYSEADIEDLQDAVEDFEVVPPLTNEPDAEDAEILDEDVTEKLEALAAEYDFSHASERDDNDE